MKAVHLETPIAKEKVRELSLGDTVYISGIIYEMRGPAQSRALKYLEENKALPFKLENSVIAQIYSSTSETDTGLMVNYSGPSSSIFVQPYVVDMMKHFGISATIGKGGMNGAVLDGMKEFGCIYLAQVGGCAAIYADHIERITEVFWKDLGDERVLALEVKDYGPLIVAMDSKGNSLFQMVREESRRRLTPIFEKL